MDDSQAFWLTLTNIALGLAVALPVLGVATGILCEFVARQRQRQTIWNDLDKELPLQAGPAGVATKWNTVEGPCEVDWIQVKRCSSGGALGHKANAHSCQERVRAPAPGLTPITDKTRS